MWRSWTQWIRKRRANRRSSTDRVESALLPGIRGSCPQCIPWLMRRLSRPLPLCWILSRCFVRRLPTPSHGSCLLLLWYTHAGRYCWIRRNDVEMWHCEWRVKMGGGLRPLEREVYMADMARSQRPLSMFQLTTKSRGDPLGRPSDIASFQACLTGSSCTRFNRRSLLRYHLDLDLYRSMDVPMGENQLVKVFADLGTAA